MARESAIIKMMKSDYAIIGLNIDDTYKKTNMLLKLYRKVNWSMGEHFDDLNDITYERCLGDTETLTYLLNFAPEKELDLFRARAVNAMETRILIELINRAVIKMKDYPDNGDVYYSIIDLKFLNFFKYTEDDILEEIDIERSTYYRKKKEATMLLGYILFGVVMPEFVRFEKVANMCDENATELRQHCDPFATDLKF